MDLQKFTEQAILTESVIDSVEVNAELLEAALAGFIASSKILDMVKKNVFYNKPICAGTLVDEVINLGYSAIDLRKMFVETHDTVDDYDVNTHKINPRIFHAIIGICTESGELAELLYSTMVLHNKFDTVNFGEELGDLDWYKAIGADAANLDQANILETVIAKLRKRFPDGFTEYDAINRNVDDERKLLENAINDDEGFQTILNAIETENALTGGD